MSEPSEHSDDQIQQALATATDTRDVVLGRGALGEVGAVFARNFPDATAIVVADGNTWEAAGEAVTASLRAAGCDLADTFTYPGEPSVYAAHDNVTPLVEVLQQGEAIPVAVGSGTLNDLVKRAAGETNRPYMVVGTAASMDGYTSFGASLEKDGHKQTMECAAPRAFVADLDVLLPAPDRLTASGYGDLIGKVPAGADWLIADALGVEPIDSEVWERVQGPLRGAIGDPEGLQAGDESAMWALTEGLVMSGLAMQAASSSRPASGAEHQFSHIWEMEGHGRDQNPPLSHGFKVGLGTIAIAALYERVLARDLTRLDIDAAVAAWPSREEMEATTRGMHDKLTDIAIDQTLGKYIGPDELRSRLERLVAVWPDLKGKLADQLLSPGELEQMLQAAKCPTRPSDIDLGFDEFRATYARARTIRTRYTILDTTFEAGILDECVDELFADGGYWADESRH